MIEEIKTKSGLTGWQCRLQENYKTFEEFESYCETYRIHLRLGYKTIKAAWDNNPMIQGSTNPSDLRKVPTIDLLVPHVDGSRGAPMGRFSNIKDERPIGEKLYDRAVPMSDGVYDKGGAYWGLGAQLRIEYNKALTYIRFYRLGED